MDVLDCKGCGWENNNCPNRAQKEKDPDWHHHGCQSYTKERPVKMFTAEKYHKFCPVCRRRMTFWGPERMYAVGFCHGGIGTSDIYTARLALRFEDGVVACVEHFIPNGCEFNEAGNELVITGDVDVSNVKRNGVNGGLVLDCAEEKCRIEGSLTC